MCARACVCMCVYVRVCACMCVYVCVHGVYVCAWCVCVRPQNFDAEDEEISPFKMLQEVSAYEREGGEGERGRGREGGRESVCGCGQEVN